MRRVTNSVLYKRIVQHLIEKGNFNQKFRKEIRDALYHNLTKGYPDMKRYMESALFDNRAIGYGRGCDVDTSHLSLVINCLFEWDETPQGRAFWLNVYREVL